MLFEFLHEVLVVTGFLPQKYHPGRLSVSPSVSTQETSSHAAVKLHVFLMVLVMMVEATFASTVYLSISMGS